MSKKNIIEIQDWAGNILFEGHKDSTGVDKTLKANRCKCWNSDKENCDDCSGTGYSGDFAVYWKDDTDKRNVYEHINY